MFEGLFQPMHLLVIALIALIIFGPKKIPELGKGLGDGIREFKKSISEVGSGSGTSVSQKSGNRTEDAVASDKPTKGSEEVQEHVMKETRQWP